MCDRDTIEAIRTVVKEEVEPLHDQVRKLSEDVKTVRDALGEDPLVAVAKGGEPRGLIPKVGKNTEFRERMERREGRVRGWVWGIGGTVVGGFVLALILFFIGIPSRANGQELADLGGYGGPGHSRYAFGRPAYGKPAWMRDTEAFDFSTIDGLVLWVFRDGATDTVDNAADYQEGRRTCAGRYFQGDGSGAHVQLDNAAVRPASDNYTFAAKILVDLSGTSYVLGGSLCPGLVIYSTGKAQIQRIGATVIKETATGYVADGEVIHFGMTREGSGDTFKFWIDGVNVTTDFVTVAMTDWGTPSDVVTLFRRSTGHPQYATCGIADVFIAPYAVAPDSMVLLTTGSYIQPTTGVFIPCVDAGGTVARDISGDAINGTIVGAVLQDFHAKSSRMSGWLNQYGYNWSGVAYIPVNPYTGLDAKGNVPTYSGRASYSLTGSGPYTCVTYDTTAIPEVFMVCEAVGDTLIYNTTEDTVKPFTLDNLHQNIGNAILFDSLNQKNLVIYDPPLTGAYLEKVQEALNHE